MTSIEFIVKELKLEGYDHTIQQAKEMHKAETIDACHKMQILDNVDYDGNVTFIFSPEQYYQETFGSRGSEVCQTFEKMYDTTSATLCANCGKEKLLHKN
jgi:hypothetical protein